MTVTSKMHRRLMREIVSASKKYRPDMSGEQRLTREQLVDTAAKCFAMVAALDFREDLGKVLDALAKALQTDEESSPDSREVTDD